MKTITTEELQGKIDRKEDFLLINTLSEHSFKQTHIPEAVNIPQDQDDFVSRVEGAAGGQDKSIVVYCANEECHSSTKAAEKLESTGFANVFDYEGGAKAWQDAGEKLIAGA